MKEVIFHYLPNGKSQHCLTKKNQIMTNRTFTSQELYLGVKENCPKVAAYLYQHLTPKIAGMLYKVHFRNRPIEEAAEEFFNEAYYRVYEAIHAGNYEESGQFKAFFMRIAYNIQHKEYEEAKKYVKEDEDQEGIYLDFKMNELFNGPDFESRLDEAQLTKEFEKVCQAWQLEASRIGSSYRQDLIWVYQLMQQLSARQQTILIHYLQCRPVEQIAMDLGITISSVKTNKSRAVERLKAKFNTCAA